MTEVIAWIVMLVAIAIFVPLLIFTSRAVTETGALETQVSTAQTRVDEIQGTMAELKQLQTKVDEATGSLDIYQQPLDRFDAQRTKVNGDLAEVTGLQSGTMKLRSISYTQGGSISVSGTAPDRSLILNYASALRDTGRFSYVSVLRMTELKFNEWGFTLELK